MISGPRLPLDFSNFALPVNLRGLDWRVAKAYIGIYAQLWIDGHPASRGATKPFGGTARIADHAEARSRRRRILATALECAPGATRFGQHFVRRVRRSADVAE